MKKLLLFTIALVLFACSPVRAASVESVKAAIVKHSIEMGVDPAITLSIAKSESGFKQETRSSQGAVGVFQLMPSTARRLGYNPYLLDDNIKAGVSYYKSMYKMFGSVELALAAYNAGPGNVKKYRAIPPFRETRRYVSDIMTSYKGYKANPDSSMLVANKTQVKANVVATKPVQPVKKKTVQDIEKNVVAVTLAPSPIGVSEPQKRNVMNRVKIKPLEIDVKSHSVAI